MSSNTGYIIMSAFILNNLFHEGKFKIRICTFFLTYVISEAGQTVIRILIDRVYMRIGYESVSFITGDLLIHVCTLGVALGVSLF